MGAPSGRDSISLQPVPQVLVVDDHPLFCEALEMTLTGGLGRVQVSTARTLGAALELLRAGLMPDMVLLDLNLPDVAGLEGMARLRSLRPDVPVVVISSMTDSRIVAAVRHAGAAGFIPKHTPRDVIVAAIRQVLAEGYYTPADAGIPPELCRQTADTRSALDKLADLTPQQGRILALICEGQLNKQIAHELSISETTVKAHVTAILRKLGAQSRTQAVHIASSASFAAILHRS